MITFDIGKIEMFGYYITILCNKYPYTYYRYDNDISDYLQIDRDDFEKSLNSYNGCYYNVGNSFNIFILYFKNIEDAELFVKEYLEPHLIVKELSQ